MTPLEFSQLRFGQFVHFGLFSLLGRGEWAWNREGISRSDYARLAEKFNPVAFDANAICDLALRAGTKYLVFTMMHHEGFRLYDSALSDFNSMKSCGRDLTREIVEAARSRGLKIGLYHSLNNWMDAPDASDALENRAAYEQFIENTHARLAEVVENYAPDILWYDGWWPFDATGWRSEEMNARLREIAPDLLFNGRNGLAGDFATPEGHLSVPNPWRPWEACLTLNGSWGFHSGDHDWKTPWQVVEMLATCANGSGNLLLNIGPRGDGSIPEKSAEILESVGNWLQKHGDAIFETDRFEFGPHERQSHHRGDWNHFGPFTARENTLFLLARRWPSGDFSISGLEVEVQNVILRGAGELPFVQSDGRLEIRGVPQKSPDEICGVFQIQCAAPPSLYLCGGLRRPRVPHPRYDPMPSDIAW